MLLQSHDCVIFPSKAQKKQRAANSVWEEGLCRMCDHSQAKLVAVSRSRTPDFELIKKTFESNIEFSNLGSWRIRFFEDRDSRQSNHRDCHLQDGERRNR